MFRRSITFSFAPDRYRRLTRPARMLMSRARRLARLNHMRARWHRWAYIRHVICPDACERMHPLGVLRVRRMYRQAKLL